MKEYGYMTYGIALFCIAGCSHKLSGNTNDVTELSVQMAREIRAASTPQCTLGLNGLRSVTPEVVDVIATYCGSIELNGLTTLSVASANSLAKHSVGDLTLNGIRDLDVECAAALSRHQGGLVLNGLTSLSPGVAEALTRATGSLTLNGLKTVPINVAKKLSKQTNWLHLDGVTDLVPEAAAALATQNGMLSLASLTHLTPDVAKALAKQKGTMLLNGVTEVSDEVATLLAAHQSEGIGLVMQNASRQQKRLGSVAPDNSAGTARVSPPSSSYQSQASGSTVASAVSQQSPQAAIQQTKVDDAGAKPAMDPGREQYLKRMAEGTTNEVFPFIEAANKKRVEKGKPAHSFTKEQVYEKIYRRLSEATEGLTGDPLRRKAVQEATAEAQSWAIKMMHSAAF